MKTLGKFLLAAGLVASLSACGTDKNENPEGKWSSAAPVSVTENIAGASSATESLTFDFQAAVNGQPGTVIYTADYDVALPASTDSVAGPTSYKVTATIQGTWTQDMDDHDDYLLTFDQNTLSVSGTDAPELGPVTDVFLKSLSKFTTIEDVEVSKDGAHMTFETKSPEVKYHFARK